MARPRRQTFHHAIHHVFARGNNRGALFLDDVDRQKYLKRLGETVAEGSWHLLAYCLMANHVHLLVETPKGNLSAGMQRLHTGFAGYLNWRHDRSGHVFQGRFGSVLIESDRQLCATAIYISRNPVEAGLCDEPRQWPWSSFGATINNCGPEWLDHRRLLQFFGSDPRTARSTYVRMALAGQT